LAVTGVERGRGQSGEAAVVGERRVAKDRSGGGKERRQVPTKCVCWGNPGGRGGGRAKLWGGAARGGGGRRRDSLAPRRESATGPFEKVAGKRG